MRTFLQQHIILLILTTALTARKSLDLTRRIARIEAISEARAEELREVLRRLYAVFPPLSVQEYRKRLTWYNGITCIAIKTSTGSQENLQGSSIYELLSKDTWRPSYGLSVTANSNKLA